MPRATAEAFLDHGRVADPLVDDLTGAHATMDRFRVAEIDYDDVGGAGRRADPIRAGQPVAVPLVVVNGQSGNRPWPPAGVRRDSTDGVTDAVVRR